MEKVFSYIREHRMICPGEKVIVGVSGGADSICLLMILMEYRHRVPFSILAVHIEHGIRGEESLADAAFVKKFCTEAEVEYCCESFDVPAIAAERKLSEEEAGRLVRYEAFETIRRKQKADKIAVAHNMNDQAETMLFHMARGSGLAGAGGIRPVRDSVIRPLLCCTREEIENYLKEKNQNWCCDRTNGELDYTRNRIRHQLLPVMEQELNRKVIHHLARLGSEIQETEDYLDRIAGELVQRGTERKDEGILCLVQEFQKEDRLIRERAVRICLKRAGCGLKNLGRIHVEQILGLFDAQSGRTVCLPGGWLAERSFDAILIRKKAKEKEHAGGNTDVLQISVPGEISCPGGVLKTECELRKNEIIPQNQYTKWLDYDKIKDNLCLRTRRPGDYLIVDEKGSRKKLKEYMIQEKIPVRERERVLLVASGREILWVVGYRINAAYKVMERTKRVLKLQWQPENAKRSEF